MSNNKTNQTNQVIDAEVIEKKKGVNFIMPLVLGLTCIVGGIVGYEAVKTKMTTLSQPTQEVGTPVETPVIQVPVTESPVQEDTSKLKSEIEKLQSQIEELKTQKSEVQAKEIEVETEAPAIQESKEVIEEIEAPVAEVQVEEVNEPETVVETVKQDTVIVGLDLCYEQNAADGWYRVKGKFNGQNWIDDLEEINCGLLVNSLGTQVVQDDVVQIDVKLVNGKVRQVRNIKRVVYRYI